MTPQFTMADMRNAVSVLERHTINDDGPYFFVGENVARFIYKNYRGDVDARNVIPGRVWYGTTEHHKTDQWLLDAFDIDKNACRTFALRDVQKWLT